MLHSKRVDFEYGVLSAAYKLHRLNLFVQNSNLIFSDVKEYIYLKLWDVMIFDVVLACINA